MMASQQRSIYGLLMVLAFGLVLAGCKKSSEPTETPNAPADEADLTAVENNSEPSAGPSDDDLNFDDLSVDTRATSGSDNDVSPANGQSATVGKTVLRIQNLQENYADNTPKRRWQEKIFTDESSVHHGFYVEYHPNGVEFIRGTYHDGKRTGEWIYKIENGNVGKKSSYVDNKLHGPETAWYSDGALKREWEYDHGKRAGHWVFYDKDGKSKVKEIDFRDDKQHGRYVEYYANGQKALEADYQNGQLHGTRQSWFQDGTQRSNESFKDGKKHGPSRSWNREGNIVSDYEFRNGRRQS